MTNHRQPIKFRGLRCVWFLALGKLAGADGAEGRECHPRQLDRGDLEWKIHGGMDQTAKDPDGQDGAQASSDRRGAVPALPQGIGN